MSHCVIHGQYAHLLPLTQADYGRLYDLYTSAPLIETWRLRGVTPSPEEFVQFLWDAVLVQFVVDTGDGDFVGLVTAYKANFRNGHAYIAAIADPEYQRSGIVVEATALLVNYLFRNWELRKVYAEVLEVNYTQFEMGSRTIFDVEGRLTEHEYVGGDYQDLLVLAVTREKWKEVGHRLGVNVKDSIN